MLQLQNALAHEERPKQHWEAGRRGKAFEARAAAHVIVQPVRDVAAVEQQRGGSGASGSQGSQPR